MVSFRLFSEVSYLEYNWIPDKILSLYMNLSQGMVTNRIGRTSLPSSVSSVGSVVNFLFKI